MKLVSWNVNGIRAVRRKGFDDYFASANADVVCLQEVRAAADQAAFEPAGYHTVWNAAAKAGYSGVAVYTRVEPHSVSLGVGARKFDVEGRLLALEFDEFFLVNCYAPNAQRGLARLPFRLSWDRLFRRRLRELDAVKPVVFCGDLNVAHREIDLARPKDNVMNPGFTIEERRSFSRTLAAGYVDTFREFVRDGGHYTWWAQFTNARARNIGWRIDYFCISTRLRPRLEAATIEPRVMGSDHCPVTLSLDAR